MNQNRIDKIGVAAAVNYFCRMGYIDPHIAFEDKVPVWDGSIDVHKYEDCSSKDDIRFNIYVQVKSSEQKSNNFNAHVSQTITVHDLELYKKHGGTLLIKVLFNKHKAQLYFAFLGKSKLNKLLAECDEQDSKVVHCIKAPKTFQELIPFLDTMHLQSQYNPITIDELKENKVSSIQITAGPVPKGQDPLIWLARNSADVLVSLLGLSEPFYLENGQMRIFTSNIVNEDVRIGNKVYFDSFTIGTVSTGYRVTIGDFLEFTDNAFIKENQTERTVNLNMKPSANIIEDYINELDFILAAHTHDEIFFGSVKLDCSSFQLSEERQRELTGNRRFWIYALSFFKKVGMPTHIDKSSFSDTDIDTIEYLINVFERKVSATNGDLSFPLASFHIGEYLICFGCQKINDHEAKLHDLKQCSAYRTNDITGEQQEFPIHSYCFTQNLFPQNLNYKGIAENYAKFKVDSDYLQLANHDTLALISEFDKTNNPVLLHAAHDLQDWIVKVNTDPLTDNLYRINILQIRIREKSSFSNEEKQFLYDLCESNSFAMRFAAHVLLNEFQRAKNIWDNHPEISDETETSAIFTLYKRLEANEQNNNS